MQRTHYMLLGEPVVPTTTTRMLHWAVVSILWGWASSLFGVDPGIVAVTMFTSACLTSIGFPMGLKYLALCILAPLALAVLVGSLLLILQTPFRS